MPGDMKLIYCVYFSHDASFCILLINYYKNIHLYSKWSQVPYFQLTVILSGVKKIRKNIYINKKAA